MPVLVLFMGMLSIMLMRVHLPIRGAPYRGRVLKTVNLSFPERLRLQRINMYAIGAFMLLLAVTGQLPSLYVFGVLATAQIILMIPVRCVLTTEGIAMSNVVYRSWNDFTGFSVERHQIRLTGQTGTRGMTLPLLAGNQEIVLPVIRRHLEETAVRRECFLHAIAQHAR